MCGMKVVVVNSDENGNIDLGDLKAKALKHKDTLVRLLCAPFLPFIFTILPVSPYFSFLHCSSNPPIVMSYRSPIRLLTHPLTCPLTDSPTNLLSHQHNSISTHTGCSDGNLPIHIRCVRRGNQDHHRLHSLTRRTGQWLLWGINFTLLLLHPCASLSDICTYMHDCWIVFVCMRVYVCVCVFAYACVYACVCLRMHVCMCVCMCALLYTRLFLNASAVHLFITSLLAFPQRTFLSSFFYHSFFLPFWRSTWMAQTWMLRSHSHHPAPSVSYSTP